MSISRFADLEARCRSQADECDRMHTLFALTGRPKLMVDELSWARDTLNTLADGMDVNEDFTLFAVLTLEAIQSTRLKAWRTAAQYTTNKAKGK